MKKWMPALKQNVHFTRTIELKKGSWLKSHLHVNGSEPGLLKTFLNATNVNENDMSTINHTSHLSYLVCVDTEREALNTSLKIDLKML